MAIVYDKNLQQIGENAIMIFHTESAVRFPSKYTITKERLFQILESRQGGKGLTLGLGLGISSADIKQEDVADAMKNLAKYAQGRIPDNKSFTFALQEEASKFSFSALGDVSIEIAKDLAEKAAVGGQKILDVGEKLGDSAISVAGSLTWLVPLLIIMVVGIFAYSYSKR